MSVAYVSFLRLHCTPWIHKHYIIIYRCVQSESVLHLNPMPPLHSIENRIKWNHLPSCLTRASSTSQSYVPRHVLGTRNLRQSSVNPTLQGSQKKTKFFFEYLTVPSKLGWPCLNPTSTLHFVTARIL